MHANSKSWGTVTEVEGVRYRSKTEAAWATFFAARGVPYAYEAVTFRNGGARYTPDFMLWGGRAFVEVKSNGDYNLNRRAYLVSDGNEFTRPSERTPLLVVNGHPSSPSMIRIFHPGQGWQVFYPSIDEALAALSNR